MDEEVFNSVTRGQFMRRAQMLATQAEQRRELPPALLEMAAGIGKMIPAEYEGE